MLIYLLRHGIAEARAATDQERQLTREGLTQTTSMVAKFKSRLPVLDKTIMSPYQRTRPTATVLRLIFPDMRLDADKQLEPVSDVYELLESIEKFGVQHLMIVSHNPLLSNLLSVMVDATMETDREIGNSTLVCVQMDFIAPGCGELLYSLEA